MALVRRKGKSKTIKIDKPKGRLPNRRRSTSNNRNVEFRLLQFFALVFIIPLSVLTVISGCRPGETAVTTPPAIEPDAADFGKMQPGEAEADTLEPTGAEANALKPKVAEPDAAEPEVEPEAAELGASETDEGEPDATEPNMAEPNEAEPNEIELQPRVSFHDKCADILSGFVDEKGLVYYKKLKHDRLELIRLLTEFAELNAREYNSWPREDKLAFWINAYNIQKLNIIVRNYPIESQRWHRFWWPPTSIRHIPPVEVVGVSKWNKYKFLVMDEEFTLALIEQRFFRKEFGEPRALFALSRASLSSPLLRNEPYYGYKLEQQLNDQTKKFLSSPRAFRIDKHKQRVYLSALLDPGQYGGDFVSEYHTDKKFKDQKPATRAVLNFITNYISTQDKSFLETESYSVRYIRYDWRLNDSSGKR
jgi:hypothetical protein